MTARRTTSAFPSSVFPGEPRIVVVGVTNAGKTTLARELARRLDIPHVELDALYWEPDRTPADPEVFRQRTAEAVQDTAWVVDGNYHAARDLVWPRATTLIRLDYPLRVVLWRLVRRTVHRVRTQETLWNGNRESVREYFSHNSLLLWALKTHQRRRGEYSAVFESPAYRYVTVVRLRSPMRTRAWLEVVLRANETGLV